MDVMRRFASTFVVALLLCGGGILPAAAQNVALDAGSFRITIGGAAAGTEEFSINRAGSGSETQIFARGEVQIQLPEGQLALRPILRTSGGESAVSGYQISVSGHRAEEISLRIGDNRFVTTTRSERGEQEREARATPNTVVLDTSVAHQYYFISHRFPSGGGSVPVIVPQEGRQFELAVTEVGEETISIGGQSVAARHLRLTGNGETRELWVDREGRVLRLEHAASGYAAVREQTP